MIHLYWLCKLNYFPNDINIQIFTLVAGLLRLTFSRPHYDKPLSFEKLAISGTVFLQNFRSAF